MSNFVYLGYFDNIHTWGAGDIGGVYVTFSGPSRTRSVPDSFTVKSREKAGDEFEQVGLADNYDSALALAEQVYAERGEP